MAPITTPADVATFTGQTFSNEQITRLGVLLPIAERNVARATGVVFYDADAPNSDASQDWLLVVSLVVSQMLRNEEPAIRAALSGPFQSENFGGKYSYSIKAGAISASLDPLSDSTISSILDLYRTSPALVLGGVVLSGPTRVAVPVFDADVSRGDYEPF